MSEDGGATLDFDPMSDIPEEVEFYSVYLILPVLVLLCVCLRACAFVCLYLHLISKLVPSVDFWDCCVAKRAALLSEWTPCDPLSSVFNGRKR